MATLQNALDKIGFVGSPALTYTDLNTLAEKFSMTCPLSTMHIDGTLRSAIETEIVDRVITQGIGGVCIELGATFKWMLDEIGFTSRLVEIEAPGGIWNRRLGVIVTIGADEYFCCFGYYHHKMCSAVKLEQDHICGQIQVDYDSQNDIYTMNTTNTIQKLKCKTTGHALSHWNTTCETESVSGTVVNRSMLCIALTNTTARTMALGHIHEVREDGCQDSEPYTNQDLLALFNYYGTIKS